MDYFLFNFSGVQFHYTMSPEKQNELETKKNIMQKQEQEKCEDDWSFHPSTELKNTKDAYYALSRLVEKIKNNISIGVK